MVYAYRAFTLNLRRTEYLLIKVVKGRIKRPKMTYAEDTLEGELPLSIYQAAESQGLLGKRGLRGTEKLTRVSSSSILSYSTRTKSSCRSCGKTRPER